MLKHLTLVPLALITPLLMPAPARAQNLRHEKYTLDNGMTVILHPDHTLPVACVNIWYRVGAKNEPLGRSGFAHLFEHLMFMGTERVPGGTFDTIMEGAGGQNNASTSLDRTNYFSSGPAHILPTLLWLDADRLENMGLNMTQEKLDKQRDIVRNELRQVVENRPYGKGDFNAFTMLYPLGHPYHYEVIGTHEDLEHASVQNVKDFFSTFYTPANASLVVAGDFDPAQIKPLIAQLYGTLPRGNTPGKVEIPAPRLEKVVRATHLDKVQQPRVAFYYHSPASYSDGDADLTLLAQILSDGPSSRLYQRLVQQEKLAVSVSASQDGATLGSVFSVSVYCHPDADLSRVEAIVDEELARVIDQGVSTAELAQRQTGVELALVSTLQSITARADKLNEYEYNFGTPDALSKDLARFTGATPASLQAWAKKILTPGARLIQRVLPEAPAHAPSARDTRPADLPAATFTPPVPEQFTLSCGAKVLLYKQDKLPLVNLSMSLRTGASLDPMDQNGRSELLAKMLEEGTRDLDNAQFASAMSALGASFGASADVDSMNVNLTGLKKNFPKAAALLADAVRAPRLASEDFERVRSLHVQELRQSDEDPRALAGRVSTRLLLGPQNPYALPGAGTPESVSRLTLDQIKAAHAELLRPRQATFILAGDLTLDEARSMLEKHFGDWSDTGVPAPKRSDDYTIPAHDALRLFILPRPGATQTQVQFRAPGFIHSDPDRVAMHLMNTVLGQAFTSRLNVNLREEHGYTYGAGSRLVFGQHLGMFVASASVKADTTGASVKEFFSEFNKLRVSPTTDITPEETDKASRSFRTDEIEQYGTLAGTVRQAEALLDVGAPLESAAADLKTAASITPEALNAVCRRVLRIERGVLVLIGDPEVILTQLKTVKDELKLPEPVLVDERGEVIKDVR